MARYFFELGCKSVVVPDKKGREFSSAEEAHFHAQMIVRQTEAYAHSDDGNDARWIIRITNTDDDFEIVVLFPAKHAYSEQHSAGAH